MEKVNFGDDVIGYRYKEGDSAEFDAYIDRLSKMGLDKEYLYENVLEIPDLAVDYSKYDEERIKKIGYPADYLRRCGIHPKNIDALSDDKIRQVCDAVRRVDETAMGVRLVWEDLTTALSIDKDKVTVVPTKTEEKAKEIEEIEKGDR